MGGVVVVEHVATMSNPNPSYLELLWFELSWVEVGLGFEEEKIKLFTATQNYVFDQFSPIDRLWSPPYLCEMCQVGLQ